MSLIPFSFWGENYKFLASGDYPTYGWSFWKRKPDYSGNCIRVRRSSDNTEQDIGFVNNFLDTASLLSFVGANTGWVVTFYDQFGSVNLTNFYTGNTGYMPRIVISGTLQTFVNGTACIPFGNGTTGNYTQLFGGSGVNMIPNTNSTLFWSEEDGASVANQVAGNSNNNTIFGLREISGTGGVNVYFDVGSTENYFVNESKLIEGYQNSAYAIAGNLYDVAAYRITTDGARLFASRGIGYNSLGTGFTLGGRQDNTNTYYRGKLNEFLIYSGSTLSESKVIEIQSILNSSHQFYNQSSYTKDLILHYDPGNSSCYPGTGTSITDLSVGGAFATLVNGVTYSSSDGGKFVLDGTNDWIGSANTNGYPWSVRGGDFSIEAYVKMANENGNYYILSNRNSTGSNGFYLIGGSINTSYNAISGKKISVGFQNHNATRGKAYETTSDIIDGNWKHIIATRTGTTFKIYINGVDQGLSLITSAGGTDIHFADGALSWRVGDGGTGIGGAFKGDIGVMRLYKCCLTQAQVTRNFNLEKSRYGL